MTVVASNYAREENDLYQTEPWATEALLRHFPVGAGDHVWEPAAGNHLMADVIRETGAKVTTSDIATYDRQQDITFDFLKGIFSGPSHSAIYTNPPYGKGNRDAVKFARIALQRCAGHVALLLTAKFDFGKTRADLFADNPRFTAKIALVDRIQWFPGDSSGTEDHAWYVWGPAPGLGKGMARLLYEGRPSKAAALNAVLSRVAVSRETESTSTSLDVLSSEFDTFGGPRPGRLKPPADPDSEQLAMQVGELAGELERGVG